jgi:two-component system OmpR family sensor kinase
MSLRKRLTLLFALLMGGVLLLCSLVVFANVSIFMVKNVDQDLKDTAQIILTDLQTDPYGKIELQGLVVKSALKQTFFQVWGADGNLQISYPPILAVPLDQNGKTAQSILIETIDSPVAKLRVLSQPILIDQVKVGTLQIAINLSQVTDTQNTLLFVLILVIVLGIAMTSIISWMITNRVLHPLEDAVATASQISRLDDLSKRIPVKTVRNDEVGVLIRLLNQTFERLEQLFISQQRFLADVSHDLRTPLTVIKGNAELMRKTGWADAESLDSIDEEVNHLTHMVMDLMLLVQAESGKLPLETKPVRLDQVIDEVVKRMKTISEGKLSLSWENPGETWVRGDSYRLKQVFNNLVSNAIQYTCKGGSITIEMSRTPKSVKVNITDTGPGISPQDLPHVFERFFRAEPSRPRTKESGFGLGLAISSWIIKHHHGEIEVKSKLGAGTTFSVRLKRFNKTK